MAEQHISLLKPFSSGDTIDWFKICSVEDGRPGNKATNIIGGEALAIWRELNSRKITRSLRRIYRIL